MARGRFPQAPYTLGVASRRPKSRKDAGSADRRRRVVDRELHCISAAPIIAAEMTGDVDRSTARLGEELAKRRPGGAEGDGP